MRPIPWKRDLVIGACVLFIFLVGIAVGFAVGYTAHARLVHFYALVPYAKACRLIDQKDDDAAIPQLYYAEAYRPDWYVAYLELGALYERRGSDKLALPQLERAIELLNGPLPKDESKYSADISRRQAEEKLEAVRARLSEGEKSGNGEAPKEPGPATSLSAPTPD